MCYGYGETRGKEAADCCRTLALLFPDHGPQAPAVDLIIPESPLSSFWFYFSCLVFSCGLKQLPRPGSRTDYYHPRPPKDTSVAAGPYYDRLRALSIRAKIHRRNIAKGASMDEYGHPEDAVTPWPPWPQQDHGFGPFTGRLPAHCPTYPESSSLVIDVAGVA